MEIVNFSRDMIYIVGAGCLGFLLGMGFIILLLFLGHLNFYTLKHLDYLWKNFKEEKGGEVIEGYRKSQSEKRRKEAST